METEPGEKPSLRALQKQRSRAHLLDTAARLIGERGFRETTIDDIAKAAGASRATLYSYFPSKDAIAHEIVVEVWDRAEALYRDFGGLDDWSRPTIRAWVGRVVEAWEASGDWLRVQSAGVVRFDDFYLDYHRRFVAALTANTVLWGRFDAADVERRALLLISGLELFLNTWMVRGWRVDRDGAIDTLTDVWCAALRSE
ncbi:TetR/AcrR family transcriptional regulator [Prescottella equi]|uniref:TetR/AcrR family transcriptional regulator n=1 Tax=Rhodococcus hoagii TaxID=43767 RepID=UPI000A1004F7|nr:TetR/AcrR family transcriptional regulator [Prescottella equi]MBM9836300.1 TetR/AcrR family transcriptional regulator [Prescottella equi]NKS96404.1 TetR family transcriptional regulator [Prescottella equi]ORM13679.1 TetR family transcriptional regulator [Prescottella equi]WJJ10269.1 helix-turn-helix domain containing protein [Prescottella equi]